MRCPSLAREFYENVVFFYLPPCGEGGWRRNRQTDEGKPRFPIYLPERAALPFIENKVVIPSSGASRQLPPKGEALQNCRRPFRHPEPVEGSLWKFHPCYPERAAEKERRRAEWVFALPRAGRMQPMQPDKLYTSSRGFRAQISRLRRPTGGSARNDTKRLRPSAFPSSHPVIPSLSRGLYENVVLIIFRDPSTARRLRRRSAQDDRKRVTARHLSP